MSAAYLDSSHDNTIPMKQPLKITLELTQQETGEHKPSVSPSFLTNNSSALWGCVPCLAHPGVPLLQECGKDGGSEMLPISSGALQGSEGTAAVWKIRHVIRTEDTFRTKQSRWKINKGNSTTTFFSPCLAYVAVHNTHPSKWAGVVLFSSPLHQGCSNTQLYFIQTDTLRPSGSYNFILPQRRFQYSERGFKCQEFPPRNWLPRNFKQNKTKNNPIPLHLLLVTSFMKGTYWHWPPSLVGELHCVVRATMIITWMQLWRCHYVIVTKFGIDIVVSNKV